MKDFKTFLKLSPILSNRRNDNHRHDIQQLKRTITAWLCIIRSTSDYREEIRVCQARDRTHYRP